jgi:hypothetical protein
MRFLWNVEMLCEIRRAQGGEYEGYWRLILHIPRNVDKYLPYCTVSYPRRQSLEVLFHDRGSIMCHGKWYPEDRSCRVLRSARKTAPTCYQTADGDDTWMTVIRKNSCSAKQFHYDYVYLSRRREPSLNTTAAINLEWCQVIVLTRTIKTQDT